MRIKKHQNRNEYVVTQDGIWVRNLCKKDVPCFDINNLVREEDCQLFLLNEVAHRSRGLSNINFPIQKKIAIISDGYDFEKKQKILENFDEKIAILAVNGVLKKWAYAGKKERHKRRINWYIVNNPYSECQKFLPLHEYYPNCIMATRTHIEFAKRYKGIIDLYHPTPTKIFGGLSNESNVYIDDYRNPICAAISIAYKMQAQKILLFCCDDSFPSQRPAAEPLENGLWCYPQHKTCHRIIDAMAYWLKTNNISIVDHSCCAKYEHAPYIEAEGLVNYFADDENEQYR